LELFGAFSRRGSNHQLIDIGNSECSELTRFYDWQRERKLPGNQKSYDEQYSPGHQEGLDHQPSALYNPLLHFNHFQGDNHACCPKTDEVKAL